MNIKDYIHLYLGEFENHTEALTYANDYTCDNRLRTLVVKGAVFGV